MVLSNSQYDEIMRGYDAARISARHELDRRTAEVYLSAPQYKALVEKAATLSVDAAKAAIRGNRELLDGIDAKMAEIKQAMSDTLVDAGFSADYLDPIYTCKDCRDTGYIDNVKCHCFKQAGINLLYTQSNIQRLLQTENFDNFTLDYYSDQYTDPATGLTPKDNMKKVLELSKNFVEQFPSGDNLLLYGDTGVGKSFLSHCISKSLLDNMHSVLYMSAIDLFEAFSKYTNEDDAPDINESQILNCELLIIDDLGTELANSFTNSKLFYVINGRLLNNQSTIISTNLSLKELMGAYSERIFSRVSKSYKLIKLYGDDIRLIKK